MTAAQAASAQLAPLAVRMSGIVMRFGAVVANRGASLEVAPGEIHAIVGENGAGKSTLMHVLTGLYEPDEGTVAVDGHDVTGWSTRQAIVAGVGMVHQHFMLVPTLTVAENVVLGREPRRYGAIDMALAQEEVIALGKQFGLVVDPRRRVAELSVGEAQRVEILKTLIRGARILVLDEPTAVLSPPEVGELWRVLRRLRDGGATTILITHKLDEVMDISERITVMRHGETTARLATADTTPADIARAMVGREVVLAHRGSGIGDREPREAGATKGAGHALEVQNLVVGTLRNERAVDGVTFAIAPGEILGVAGVEGNGQTELIEALAGLREVSSGNVMLGNRDITRAPVRERTDGGLAHIPEDRQRRGLVLDFPVADNLVLGLQHRYTRAAQIDRAAVVAQAERQVRTFDIRPPDASRPARALSGGNQQKIVIAREMGRDYSVLLAAQPTRGVDVGAIEFIHSRLLAARAEGKAILLVSAELSEVLALADRIAVMYRGAFVAILPRAEATTERLGALMTGATSVPGATPP
ncbi:MAG TPA: ABC transporter ATP-binding protein [Gemmatimonadaceae bacterium]|nr:ABC transporter ATP-binding protein [Gemmatimonadaceae bacterium]